MVASGYIGKIAAPHMPKGIKGFQKNHPPFYKNGKGINLDRNNGNWKGDDVGYIALHSWIRRRLGIPDVCLLEDSTCKGRFEWANISHEYKRDLNDYVSLCKSHHTRFDCNRET